MITSSELAALIADPGKQRHAQTELGTALAAWHADPGVAPVLADFERYAAGTALGELPALAALFRECASGARRLVEPLLEAMCGALAGAPLGIVPLRHCADGTMSSLLLAHRGAAMLTLVAIDGAGLAARTPPTSVCLAEGEEWEIVLAGRGAGRLVERRGGKLRAHPVDLAPGVAFGREAGREALVFDRVDGVLLGLRLQRRGDLTIPKREFALADGALLRQASASSRESRHEVAVALLGRMGRTDAAPLLAEIARDDRLGDSLRWQALRECLGLDTAAGFWTLTAIARAGADPLAVPAGALRAQLLEAHPQLAEVDLCRV